MKPKVIFLVGPTAIGKTDLSLALARKLNAEIISCDSMQVYKSMDILTSKPGLKMRKKIPHHLIDAVSVDKEYNVSQYRTLALKKINQIHRKGKTPLFVGGSGLYMSVVIDGIFRVKTENPQVRQQLYRQAEKFGSAKLYEKLLDADPQAAAKIHPNDTKRIIRALEVFKVTGKPISRLQVTRKGLSDKYEIKILGLDMPRELLYQRIDARVDEMFKQGLVAEVKKLLRRSLSKTARAAIGINEIKGYLDGRYDLEEARRLVKINSRHYAKRQLTWFRKDKRIIRINITGDKQPSKIVEELWKKLY
jgi:tRNA dimethylallyltransferase